MSKYFLLLIGIAVVSISVSCSNPASPTSASSSTQATFYIEVGRLINTDFDAVNASIPQKSSYTFTEISSYRALFRAKYQYDFSSSPNNSRDSIYNALTSRGFTPTEANSTISSIVNTGNGILLFSYAYSANYKIWMYLEKQ